VKRTPSPPKVPFLPLYKAFIADGAAEPAHALTAMSVTAGVDRSGLYRCLATDTVSVWMADEIAIRSLNRHPVEIWGDDWLDPDSLHHPSVDRAVRIDHAFQQLRKATR
jgi:lambda repressor-like predicted transcriptional regulator